MIHTHTQTQSWFNAQYLVQLWNTGKVSTCQSGSFRRQVQSLGWEDSLEEGMATHSSILAWRIPWTEEPAGPQSMDLQKSQKRLSTHAFTTINQFTVWKLVKLLSIFEMRERIAIPYMFYCSLIKKQRYTLILLNYIC